MSLLAVDDNQAHCYAMCRVLRHAGYEVFEAHTVTDALKIAEAKTLDLALLDINLPDGTGYELLRALKKHPHNKGLAVIIHTATEPTQLARQKAESLGAAAFLTYPIEPRDLVNVVKGVLAKDTQRRGSGVIEQPATHDASLLPPDRQQPFKHLVGLSPAKISKSGIEELQRLLESAEILLRETRVAAPFRQTIEELRLELRRAIAGKRKVNGNGGN